VNRSTSLPGSGSHPHGFQSSGQPFYPHQIKTDLLRFISWTIFRPESRSRSRRSESIGDFGGDSGGEPNPNTEQRQGLPRNRPASGVVKSDGFMARLRLIRRWEIEGMSEGRPGIRGASPGLLTGAGTDGHGRARGDARGNAHMREEKGGINHVGRRSAISLLCFSLIPYKLVGIPELE
jgi:hypothetical protein